MRNVWMCGLLSLGLLLTACGDDDASKNNANNVNNANNANNQNNANNVIPMTGEELYMLPHVDGNTFACSTCHAITEPAGDGFIRPGHPIGDAAARPSYKNGAVADFRAAVNSCRVEWMNAPAYEEDDENWVMLRDFLSSQAPETAEALTFEIQPAPTAAELEGGDMEAGKEFFNTSCVVCHGVDAAGTERAPSLSGEFLDAELIGRRVRTSGKTTSTTYDGLTGGVMPFWAADRISDEQLQDVVAFLLQNEPPENNANNTNNVNNTNTNNANNNNGMRDCGTTHSKVGQTGAFSTFAHQVSGFATIVDDCTIELTNFFFDGQGINVQLYGALNGNYAGGFSMSEDLRQQGGYQDVTLRFQLPEDKTLDDLDGVSIWCVPVGASFGDTLLE